MGKNKTRKRKNKNRPVVAEQSQNVVRDELSDMKCVLRELGVVPLLKRDQKQAQFPPDYLVNNALAHAAGYLAAVAMLITIGMMLIATSSMQPAHEFFVRFSIGVIGAGSAYFAGRWGRFGLEGHKNDKKKKRWIGVCAVSGMIVGEIFVALNVMVLEHIMQFGN